MIEISENKKIIFVGPANSGKTSIKRVFFEKASPLNLLKNPLNPSRGLDSNIFSILNIKLGIFDLAGQENDYWFSDKGNYIFEDANLIFCVFDIRKSLEYLTDFILKIFKIKRTLNLENCEIIILLHKVDLVSHSYSKAKLVALKNFFHYQCPKDFNFDIKLTSISHKYFYKTFKIFAQIMNSLLNDHLSSLSLKHFQKLEKALEIIINSKIDAPNQVQDLARNLNLNIKQLSVYLNKLERINLIRLHENYYELTDRGYLIKEGIENEIEKINNDLLSEKSYIFRELTGLALIHLA